MNPFSWHPSDRIAGIAFGAAGAIAGMVLAWIDSPYRRICNAALSGDRADCAQMFSLWIAHPSQYWLISAVCAAVPALAFYGFHLTRKVPR